MYNYFVYNIGDHKLDLRTTLTIMRLLPAGSSLMTIWHYFQLHKSGRFSKFDHGLGQNVELYGTAHPPEYNLSNVVAPTVLYVGDGDDITNLRDTWTLAEKLPNVAYQIVNMTGWNHMDFMYSRLTGELVYQHIINDLKGKR